MAQGERDIINDRLEHLGADERRFRINAGTGWVAGPEQTVRVDSKRMVPMYPGDILLRQARPFHGAPAGWPDLAGWDAVTVTPEMVGTTVAVFVGEEVKTGKLKLSRFQRMFRDVLMKMGGRFRTVR